jgi:acyl carrier protein
MIPTAFVWLEAIPLTPSRKIDRRALPAPAQARPTLAEAYVNPRTPTEEVVVGIWASVLRIEHVGIHDNFFDLGGHSLLAMQVMSRLRDALQVEVPLRALFDAPTVAGLTLHIETVRQAKPVVPAPPIVPRPRQDTAPVCVVQEQIWRFEQLLPGLPLFNIPYAMSLTGTLDVAALEQSYNEIIRRHEALRTTFVSVDGRPLQTIAPALHLPMQVVDLSSLPERRKRAEAQRLTRAAAQEPFDLAQGPLLRVQLLRLGAQGTSSSPPYTTSSATGGRSVYSHMSSPSYTPLSLPETRPPCRHCPSSTPTLRTGSSSGGIARHEMPPWPTGKSSCTTLCPCWHFPQTVPGRQP